jgi:hypothetical protein
MVKVHSHIGFKTGKTAMRLIKIKVTLHVRFASDAFSRVSVNFKGVKNHCNIGKINI